MNFDNRGIFLFDISTYQDSPHIPGGVDFRRMRDVGASAVIIKAGQGSWKDPDFDTNWSGAKGYLPRGSYWYYDNRYPPKDQARKYWDIIRHDPEGICWLDLEDKTVSAYSGWKNWYEFLIEFRALSGFFEDRIGIYTGYYYWMEQMQSANEYQRAWFGIYPLWLAWYVIDPFNPDFSQIRCPKPWAEPMLLQSGTPAIGRDVGVESEEIDLNLFNGDEAEFARHFKLTETLPPPDGEPTNMTTFTGTAKPTSTPNVRVRRAYRDGTPDINGMVVAGIQPSQAFKADAFRTASDGKEWVHVIEVGGRALTEAGWSAGWLLDYRKPLEPQPDPAPAPQPGLPEYFIVTAPDGASAKYVRE